MSDVFNIKQIEQMRRDEQLKKDALENIAQSEEKEKAEKMQIAADCLEQAIKEFPFLEREYKHHNPTCSKHFLFLSLS